MKFPLLVAALACCSLTPGFGAPILTHVDVYRSGTDGYHTFRIPVVETAADGTLIAFAEARKNNAEDPGLGEQDIDLVYKRSTDRGATWSPMVILEDPGVNWSAANPATLLDRSNGRLWVFYIHGRPQRSAWNSRPGTDDMRNFARWSDDHGRSWSKPIDLTEVARDMNDSTWRVSWPGPGGAIQTTKGRLVVALGKFPYESLAIYSDDHGQTWQRGQKVPGPDVRNECQVVELNDGRLLIDMRQEAEGPRWLAESNDGGATWGTPRPGVVATPVACAIERYTPAGAPRSQLLWTGPQGPGRKELVIRTSTDDGLTFPRVKTLSTDLAAYSEITVLKDNSVGVIWERGTEKSYQYITFTRVNQEWMEGK
jgi:sialidase-1